MLASVPGAPVPSTPAPAPAPTPSSDDGAVGSTSYGGGKSITKLEGSMPKGGWGKPGGGGLDLTSLLGLLGSFGGGQAGPRYGGQAGPRYGGQGGPAGYVAPLWQAGGMCGTPEKMMTNPSCSPRGGGFQDENEAAMYRAQKLGGGGGLAALMARIASLRSGA